MTATERITLVVINEDMSRDKYTLSSWVGIPRKNELMWIQEQPYLICLLYTSPSPRDRTRSRMPSSA